ncbi:MULTISPECIES: hypothetical protein [unclassified Mesorhizobium]|uniref:hypothetical protein n=1 Tax=unclassified Mesorhizobium TaxID=325217 RepID=UPI0012EB87B9|nr:MULTISPECIES: hypothetical protein [unclassified Mesorhizobium]WJI67237.1 hypothetical protein NLY36_20315 [Mesorhizobium sp. C399B]
MVINLHERLSEFSYGYGVTREIESLLQLFGCTATPFLPSLIHEEELGFDVSFSSTGGILLAQFKLGQQLERFRRTANETTVPTLDHPFWQFRVDVGGHQFQRLIEFETSGAQVFYSAPRFATWQAYDAAYQSDNVLSRSLLIKPSDILAALAGASGIHRIVYDITRRYVCSDPRIVREYSPEQMAASVRENLQKENRSLGEQIERLYQRKRPRRGPGALQMRRIDSLMERAKNELDGMAAVVALEAWTQGAQLIFVGTQLQA